jgi:hypothetical protein
MWDLAMDTVKEDFGCLGCFYILSTHLERPERTYYLCPSKKRELAE